MPPRNNETTHVRTIQIAVPIPIPFALAEALYGSNAEKPKARPATYMSVAMPVATIQPPRMAPHLTLAYGCTATTVSPCSMVYPSIKTLGEIRRTAREGSEGIGWRFSQVQ